MKNWRQMLAFMLAAVLTFGTLEISAIASEDAGAVVEAFAPSEEGTEKASAGPENRYDKSADETVSESRAAGEAAAGLAVLLDANGGYFPDAWDDELNETVEKAE